MWHPSGMRSVSGVGLMTHLHGSRADAPLQDRQLNGSLNHDRVAREHGVPENSIKFALRSQVREPTTHG